MAPPEIGLKLMEVSKTMAADMEKAVDGFISLGFPEDFIKSHPKLKAQIMAQRSGLPPTPPETADRTMKGIMSFNSYDRLPQIKCPVLIVHGDQDQLVPVENAQILKDRIPQAELYIVPGAGHMFLQIDPVGVHRRIVDFLKKPLSG